MLADAESGFDVAGLLGDWEGDDERVDVLVEQQVIIVAALWRVFGVDGEL